MTTEKEYIKNELKAKNYIKDNIWKQFGKQKLFEVGIIPTAIASIYYIPYWIGILMLKLIGYDNYLHFTNLMIQVNQETLIRLDIWSLGFMVTAILTAFIFINFILARETLLNRASEKFNVSRFDINDVKIIGKN